MFFHDKGRKRQGGCPSNNNLQVVKKQNVDLLSTFKIFGFIATRHSSQTSFETNIVQQGQMKNLNAQRAWANEHSRRKYQRQMTTWDGRQQKFSFHSGQKNIFRQIRRNVFFSLNQRKDFQSEKRVYFLKYFSCCKKKNLTFPHICFSQEIQAL